MTITTFQPNQSSKLTNTLFVSIHDDIIKPEMLRDMIKEHPEELNTFNSLLSLFGYKIPVQGERFSAFFKNWTWDYVTETVGWSAGGTTGTLTIGGSDVANNSSFPRIGDTIFIKDATSGSYVQAAITNKTPAGATCTFDFVTVDGSTLPAVAASTPIGVASYAAPYGGATPTGRNSSEIIRHYNLQIFADSFSAQGHLKDPLTFVQFVDAYGNPHPSLFSREVADAQFRLEKGIGAQFMFGYQDDGSLTASSAMTSAYGGDASQPIKLTKGLWQHGVALGATDAIPIGGFTLATVMDIRDHYINQGYGNSIANILGGYRRIGEIEDALLAANYNTGIDYKKELFGAAEGIGLKPRDGWEISFSFKGFEYAGMKIMLTELADFSDPRLMGQLDFQYNAIVMPMGTNVLAKVNGSSRRLPMVARLYKQQGAYSREMEIWYDGGAGGNFTYTNNLDYQRVNYRAHQGLFVAGANALYLITK